MSSNELLFNTRNSRELVGKTTVVPTINKKIVANNNILRITTFGNIQTKFLNYILISPYGKNLFFNLTTATTNVAAIYQKQLREITIPLPPLSEQSRIFYSTIRKTSDFAEVEGAGFSNARKISRARSP
ncbi:restriction endonuclease subunit S [Lactobacillus paragasseri]